MPHQTVRPAASAAGLARRRVAGLRGSCGLRCIRLRCLRRFRSGRLRRLRLRLLRRKRVRTERRLGLLRARTGRVLLASTSRCLALRGRVPLGSVLADRPGTVRLVRRALVRLRRVARRRSRRCRRRVARRRSRCPRRTGLPRCPRRTRLLARQTLEALVELVEADRVHTSPSLLGQLEAEDREGLLLLVELGADELARDQTTSWQVPVGFRPLGHQPGCPEPHQERVGHRRNALELSGHEDSLHVLLLGQVGQAQTGVSRLLEELPHPRVVVGDIPAAHRHPGQRLEVHVQERGIGAVLREDLLPHWRRPRSLEPSADGVARVVRPVDGVPVELAPTVALGRCGKQVLLGDGELLLAAPERVTPVLGEAVLCSMSLSRVPHPDSSNSPMTRTNQSLRLMSPPFRGLVVARVMVWRTTISFLVAGAVPEPRFVSYPYYSSGVACPFTAQKL